MLLDHMGALPEVLELSDDLQAPLLPREDSLLQWWPTVGKAKYKKLVTVAEHYLEIPATQAPNERLFSTCSNAVTSSRETVSLTL